MVTPFSKYFCEGPPGLGGRAGKSGALREQDDCHSRVSGLCRPANWLADEPTDRKTAGASLTWHGLDW
jgi:hypothetical protein